MGLVLCVLGLAYAVVVGVPTLAAARSASYRTACAFAAGSDEVRQEVGLVLSCARAPQRFTFEGSDRVLYAFLVDGGVQPGLVRVRLERASASPEVWRVVEANCETVNGRQRRTRRLAVPSR